MVSQSSEQCFTMLPAKLYLFYMIAVWKSKRSYTFLGDYTFELPNRVSISFFTTFVMSIYVFVELSLLKTALSAYVMSILVTFWGDQAFLWGRSIKMENFFKAK